MPAYHSAYNEATEYNVMGNMAILPLRTRIRGPAPSLEDPSQPDIIDEAINLFRANSLFRNFEIKGAADRVLIYLILYIADCLNKIASPVAKGWTANEAVKQLTTLALENFALPGEAGFPIKGLFQAPASRQDADTLRQYLSQCRQEMAPRLIEKVYGDTGNPSKWWMAFQKRRFLGKSLSGP